MKLLEVKKASDRGELPIKLTTAYKWHSMLKHPNLLFKLHGKLFWDVDEWYEMAATAKAKHVAKANRLREVEENNA